MRSRATRRRLSGHSDPLQPAHICLLPSLRRAGLLNDDAVRRSESQCPPLGYSVRNCSLRGGCVGDLCARDGKFQCAPAVRPLRRSARGGRAGVGGAFGTSFPACARTSSRAAPAVPKAHRPFAKAIRQTEGFGGGFRSTRPTVLLVAHEFQRNVGQRAGDAGVDFCAPRSSIAASCHITSIAHCSPEFMMSCNRLPVVPVSVKTAIR